MIGDVAFGNDVSFTGERVLVIVRAVGGPFLVPLSIGRLGMVVVMVWLGGRSEVALLANEYRLLDEFGTLKFGADGERL